MTKNQSWFLVITALSFVGCATTPASTPQTASWENQCYRNFERDVSEIAGETATDCGFLSRNASKLDRTATKKCAAKAVKSGLPFKFGYSSVRIDSFICDVAVRQTDGQLISLFSDSYVRIPPDPNGNRVSLSVTRCTKLILKPGNNSRGSFFDLQNCTEATDIFAVLPSQK